VFHFVAQMSMLQMNLLSWNCHEIRRILILQLDDKGEARYLIRLLCNNKLIGRLIKLTQRSNGGLTN